MIKTKLYLYDSSATNYKGTEYSNNIKAEDTHKDDLTEEMDIYQITLIGLTRSAEFAPTTKFIMEKYDVIEGVEVPYRTYHIVVMQDVVSQPVLSDDNYFNHNITFTEPSVIAQGRIVDNMALTYKLKDVSINLAPTFNINDKANPIPQDAVITQEQNNGYFENGNPLLQKTQEYRTTRRFDFDWTNSKNENNQQGSLADWEKVKKNILNDSNDPTKIVLPIPMITTQFGNKDATIFGAHKNYCSISVNIQKRQIGSEAWSNESGYPLRVDPSTTDANEGSWENDWLLASKYSGSAKGYGFNRAWAFDAVMGTLSAGDIYLYYKKFAEFANSIQNRKIELTLASGYEYKIWVELYNFDTPTTALGNIYKFYGDQKKDAQITCYARLNTYLSGLSHTSQTSGQSCYATSSTLVGVPSLSMQFNVYEQGGTSSYQFKSAPPVSAYDLFMEAQIKSQTTMKEKGVFVKDMELTYYLEPNDANVLKNTQVVESMFNEKNFWEILLEIGKYIHAIPYIEFGKDDRFIVRWRYLGQTTMSNNTATTISIFNSRSIENYVCALSSYVNNIMQLGGQIEEWIVPHSESDDLLVYNDVAKLYTTKPIMQIDDLYIRCIKSGAYYTKDTQRKATEYIFEKNVYDLLDITESYTTNKGKAIYYRLGENVIDGLTYQLPNVNTGATNTDYAIKRIIGTLFGIAEGNWKYTRVNDFAFKIIYRTKETARSEQSRPDLRKYLVNSKYEIIPFHKQFNNQQDKVVDSVKFGNKNYGELIRTGNTEFTTTEWNEHLSELKIAGQLVNIRGNIYYVSKATHTFYQDHITSEITYSKDYNQLSEIIGIPSEPRFFEISEQSMITRDTIVDDMFILTTDSVEKDDMVNTFAKPYKVGDFIMSNATYPKYAITHFENDVDNSNSDLHFIDIIKPISAYSMRNTLNLKWEMQDSFSAGEKVIPTAYWKTGGDVVNTDYSKLVAVQYADKYGRVDLMKFAVIDDIPSSFLNNTNNFENLPISPIRLGFDSAREYVGQAQSYTDANENMITIHPYSDEYIDVSTHFAPAHELYDTNGNVMQLQQYRTYMVDDGSYVGFYYYQPSTFGQNEGLYRFLLLPSGCDTQKIIDYLSTTNLSNSGATEFTQVDAYEDVSYDICLLKDCREKITINYNIQMLTDSDRFVLSGFLWQQKKDTIKLALLNEEVNKIVNDTIPSSSIIGYDINDTAYSYLYDVNAQPYDTQSYEIDIASALSGLTDEQKSQIKGIALVSTAIRDVGNGYDFYFTMARNVSDLANADKIKNWYIRPIHKSLFERQ